MVDVVVVVVDGGGGNGFATWCALEHASGRNATKARKLKDRRRNASETSVDSRNECDQRDNGQRDQRGVVRGRGNAEPVRLAELRARFS
jgi:hypothetical protein